MLNEDRTHILNVSWNAFLPDGAKGGMDNAIGRGHAQRLAAVGHLVARERHSDPAQLQRRGRRSDAIAAAYFGTADVVGPSGTGGNGLAPVYTCDPRLGGNKVGEKILDINCIARPGSSARTATWCRRTTCGRRRGSNHDLTLFKNFAITGDQKLQFRVGFFNLFNQAFANTHVGGTTST